jgi:hypothetical protein
MTEVKLSSGAKLEITLADFDLSKALYQAVLEEFKSMKIDEEEKIGVNLFKNVFCLGFSSKKIEFALWACMTRVLYNGLKVTKETFEPAEARGDYMDVCFEVAKENISPFTKSLYAKYYPILQDILKKNGLA